MRLALPLLIVLNLAFAPAPVFREKRDDRTDLKKLQGEWVEIAVNTNGVPDQSKRGAWSMMVVGDRISWFNLGDLFSRSSVTLDTSKSPRAMTLTREIPAGRVGEITYSRYRVDGDTLTYCRALDGSLPGSLDPGKGVLVSVYKRKRP